MPILFQLDLMPLREHPFWSCYVFAVEWLDCITILLLDAVP